MLTIEHTGSVGINSIMLAWLDRLADRSIFAGFESIFELGPQDLFVPRAQLESGSSEIRNWICAAGALEHLDLDWVDYFPGYRTSAGTGTGLCFARWA